MGVRNKNKTVSGNINSHCLIKCDIHQLCLLCPILIIVLPRSKMLKLVLLEQVLRLFQMFFLDFGTMGKRGETVRCIAAAKPHRYPKKRSKIEGTSSCEAVDVSQYTLSDLETDESDSDTET